jgi:putative transposase
LSEQYRCRLVCQPRGTQRYLPPAADEDRLTQSIVALASQYGRFGCRRITVLLNQAGWKLARTECSASGGAKA